MMDLNSVLAVLQEQPLVVSVQASEGSPLDDVEALLRLAKASAFQGIKVLRLEGGERIKAIKKRTACCVIGLVKRRYEGSDVYITPTVREVEELLEAGCEVIALDATHRPRPHDEHLQSLVTLIHRRGALAMADCDSVESAQYAIECGADLVGTTLAGYTAERVTTVGPDLNLVRELVKLRIPVIAEGRFSQRWEVDSALQIGASAVVVGGAINDAVKTTRAMLPSRPVGEVSALDIGGTWLRYGRFSSRWEMLDRDEIALPKSREDRSSWIQSRISGASVVGISTGGTVDPASNEVWESKPIIPDHQGTAFQFDRPTLALNDGLACAWGHACHPRFAGKRVATLALGTGVGAGFVSEGKIQMGKFGEYPRINDLPLMQGRTVEEVLGGLNLVKEAPDDAKSAARLALEASVNLIRTMWFPDDIVVCGSVGLADWMADDLEKLELHRSPFAADAGLYGAAALALFPGWRRS